MIAVAVVGALPRACLAFGLVLVSRAATVYSGEDVLGDTGNDISVVEFSDAKSLCSGYLSFRF